MLYRSSLMVVLMSLVLCSSVTAEDTSWTKRYGDANMIFADGLFATGKDDEFLHLATISETGDDLRFQVKKIAVDGSIAAQHEMLLEAPTTITAFFNIGEELAALLGPKEAKLIFFDRHLRPARTVSIDPDVIVRGAIAISPKEVALVGSSVSSSERAGMLIRIDIEGSETFRKEYVRPGREDGAYDSIVKAQLVDDRFFFLCETHGNGGPEGTAKPDRWVLVTDLSGNVLRTGATERLLLDAYWKKEAGKTILYGLTGERSADGLVRLYIEIYDDGLNLVRSTPLLASKAGSPDPWRVRPFGEELIVLGSLEEAWMARIGQDGRPTQTFDSLFSDEEAPMDFMHSRDHVYVVSRVFSEAADGNLQSAVEIKKFTLAAFRSRESRDPLPGHPSGPGR